MLFGFSDIKEIRAAFIEDYDGKVDEKAAREFDRDMRGLIVAYLDGGGYEESARFLLLRGKQLYEVEASHCSCNDFGGQWTPEPVEWEQLAMRPPGWFSYGYKEANTYVEKLVARMVKRRAKLAEPTK